MTTKEKIVRIMDTLPEDATIDDAMYRLELLQSIEEGLNDIEGGRFIEHDELFERLLNEDEDLRHLPRRQAP